MKYSIRGNICCDDGTDILTVINKYYLWRLIPSQVVNDEGMNVFTFEVWVNTEADKTSLFNELKPFVVENSVIDWHKCTHDEVTHKPCVIIEEYRGG